LIEGNRLRSHDGLWVVLNGTHRTSAEVPVYNLRIADYHTYFVGSREWGFSVLAHNARGGQGSGGASVTRSQLQKHSSMPEISELLELHMALICKLSRRQFSSVPQILRLDQSPILIAALQ